MRHCGKFGLCGGFLWKEDLGRAASGLSKHVRPTHGSSRAWPKPWQWPGRLCETSTTGWWFHNVSHYIIMFFIVLKWLITWLIMTNHVVFLDLLICWFGLSQPTDYKGLEKDAMSKSPNRKALNSPIHSLSAPRKPTFCWRISMSHLAQQLASSEVLPRWTVEVHVGNISGDTDHNWVTHRNRRVEIPKRTTDL